MGNALSLYYAAAHRVARSRRLTPTTATLRRGELLIWRGNLLHGGLPVLDWNRTRKALTTHYFLQGTEQYWAPLASAESGLWRERWRGRPPDYIGHRGRAFGKGWDPERTAVGRPSSTGAPASKLV